MSTLEELFRRIRSSRTAPGPITHMIVGLGNPGPDYDRTRHNMGFCALDELARRVGARINRAGYHALWGDAEVGGARALLLKPQTYMNLSGQAVREAADYYKIPPERILVLCDDVSFEVGQMRLRRKGSAGGHNGLKSVIEALGTEAFPRIRLGAGKKPSPETDLADWVLGGFSPAEKEKLPEVWARAAEAAEMILRGEMEAAMARFSG
ncbi:MAG: aminoacyl-tRNA hydrolase [Clostridia bacterium]|nr:aminoacyl-tRNA hydrolase [Clostridia bacterium]